MRMRFLIDENLSPDLVGAIKQLDASIDVRFVRGPDAPPEGTPDPDILLFCEAERLALITNNRTSMPTHERDHFAAGRQHYNTLRKVGEAFIRVAQHHQSTPQHRNRPPC